MLLSLFILILASALPSSILTQIKAESTSALSSPPLLTPTMHRHLHMKRNHLHKKRIWKPSRTHQNPTRVSKIHNPQRRSGPEGQTSKRHTRRADPYKQTRVYLALSDCLTGIQARVKNIRAIANYGINSQNAQQIAWALLEQLKGILAGSGGSRDFDKFM